MTDIMRVSSAPIHALSIGKAFSSLSPREKLYAHYLSRAAWHGTRIILRQVSPESIGIFDFILEVFASCSGNWDSLVEEASISSGDLDTFLEYAATFLSNIGNYYGSGDQKFVPSIPGTSLQKLAQRSASLRALYNEIYQRINIVPPYGLGFPSDRAQSAYYPGDSILSQEEISLVSRILEERSIRPENTRIRKTDGVEGPTYEILQASVDQDPQWLEFSSPDLNGTIKILPGDHSKELASVCACMSEAIKYTTNNKQKLYLSQYIQSFQTGSLETYRESQRTWIQDKSPRVENIFGFVEPYRDPFGIRAEFEGLVGITDLEETISLMKLVEHSATFIRRLPWARGADNDGKGPFEKTLFEPPDFTSIHGDQYNDIREQCGFKNVIIANRMSAESSKTQPCPFIHVLELESFQRNKYPAYYWWVVLHELLGHGTGKMMVEESVGKFNFDRDNPPIDPLTGKPIVSWYKPGQTWTGQFGDLATTVDECRAELVGAYLMDDTELLGLFGYNEGSEITADDLTYNLYQQLGVDGLRGLADFNVENKKWGQAHSRAHFSILKCLLADGRGCVTVQCDSQTDQLIVQVDRSKIKSHGKPALGQMLLRLHMYRCTADAQSCRDYYEELSRVHDQYLVWRDIVLAKKQPKWVFVQANTFLRGEEVILKEYEPTPRGVIQSWAERKV
ncbi:peptidase M49, dipeptidyl-peptidase III [Lindgomyces ingoldianus]|uniref:Peptidase M49, dipeptidyl-peptidase III n=1 Tax=Lindgomyces ingoldianus TaxID=673940 RepID=A0ACB6REI6_9PLEO|nr:peptidase M49, dipeptidyl-peptidase III [Lindgomyces ingoldianus]KAF2477130.1 peptidase M49, dipeptidyl-peptidase III [Lindgomyces ingoldianus]